jgi:hypothetical protein
MSDEIPGMVSDPEEVARFAAERDQDIASERRLFLGQAVVLLVIVALAIAMATLGGR